MSSTFSFEDGPQGPGLDPTQHEGFEDDVPQFIDPRGGLPFIPSGMYEDEVPMAPEPETEEMPEDEFDPRSESDVTGLLFLGFLSRSCDVYGHTFVLRTLKGAEDLAVSQIIDEQPGLASSSKALMYAQVAAALVTVDGKPVATPLNDSFEQVVATIRQNIDRLLTYHPKVTERLFEEYQGLAIRVDDAFKDYEGKLTAGRPFPLP